jgi:hypothetical protein
VQPRQRRHLAFFALWMVSLGLRVVFFAGVDVHETVHAEAADFSILASNLANRGIYSHATEAPLEPHVRWPPGYPLLLAPFYRGRDLRAGTEAALAAQVVIGSALPLLVVVLGRRMLPAPAAWLAGVLVACCPALVTTPAFLVPESHFAILLVLTLLSVARLLERPAPLGALASGVLCGTLALVRRPALLLPAAIALHLAARAAPAPGGSRRATALLFLAAAAAVIVPWEVRMRAAIAAGAPRESYVARSLAESLYPDFRYRDAPRGYPWYADPGFARFSTSVGSVLAELWKRTRAEPWPNLRWQLGGKYVALWSFDLIQSPPIHIFPVERGLFRPAAINPEGRDEPLAPLYRLFSALYRWAVVPGSLAGFVLAIRNRRAPAPPGTPAAELLCVTVAYATAVYGTLDPLPRNMLPLRPLLYLLALTACVEVGRRLARRPLRT